MNVSMNIKEAFTGYNLNALHVYADILEELTNDPEAYFFSRNHGALEFFIGNENYKGEVTYIDAYDEDELDELFEVVKDSGDVILLTVDKARALIESGVDYNHNRIEGYENRKALNIREYQYGMTFDEAEEVFVIGEPFED